MKGIELAEAFYNECAKEMLEKNFSHLMDKIAIGICGSGSECFGYDDELSQDHDFEPGFCIFLPSEKIVDSKEEFQLERAYLKLPKEFKGYKRSNISPVGGARHGVIRISEFFKEKTGTENAELSIRDWLSIPEQSLAEATNGKIFYDGLGEITKMRSNIKYLPQDVRIKKLAGNLLIMAQSGQYNYQRCIKRGETGSAQLAIFEFVKSAINVVFLLNKRYTPYYKWAFKAFRGLLLLSCLEEKLEYLLTSSNDKNEPTKKQEAIEEICAEIINELKAQELSCATSQLIEEHAYSVNQRVRDISLRTSHILSAI